MTVVKQTGRATSMPRGLMIGLIVDTAVTMAGCVITAKLIDTELMSQNKIGYAAMVILIVASMTGAIISYRRIQRQKLMVSLLSAACYYGMLLVITGLLFGAQYDGAGETALLVICGSLLPVVIKPNGKSSRKIGKIKVRNR